MIRMCRFVSVVLVILLAPIAVTGVAAQEFLVIPSGNASSWGDGSASLLTRENPRSVQWIFPQAELGSLAAGDSITAIAWRSADSGGNPPSWPTGDATWNNYDIFVGAAAVPRASQSTSYAANRGAGFIQVRSGPLTIPSGTLSSYTGQATPGPFELVIPFSTPFVYQGGDLLIEVRHDGNEDQVEFFLDRTDSGQRLRATGYDVGTGELQDRFTILRLTVQRGDGGGAVVTHPVPTMQWYGITILVALLALAGLVARRKSMG